MIHTPPLVVVTIVKDDLNAFLTTLRSIQIQTQHIKHIVIDGSTNKENRKEIASASSKAGSVYVHQPPKGIYPAMNCGLDQCQDDELVMFLNAGDYFAQTNSATRVVIDSFNLGRNFLIYPCQFGQSSHFIPSIEGVSAVNVARGRALVCHQGVVVAAKLIRQAGSFDETYSISADHKLLLRLLQITEPQVFSTPIAVVSLGGVSDTNCGVLARENERARLETGMSFDSLMTDKIYTLRRLMRCRSKLLLRKTFGFLGFPSSLPQQLMHRRK